MLMLLQHCVECESDIKESLAHDLVMVNLFSITLKLDVFSNTYSTVLLKFIIRNTLRFF